MSEATEAFRPISNRDILDQVLEDVLEGGVPTRHFGAYIRKYCRQMDLDHEDEDYRTDVQKMRELTILDALVSAKWESENDPWLHSVTKEREAKVKLALHKVLEEWFANDPDEDELQRIVRIAQRSLE